MGRSGWALETLCLLFEGNRCGDAELVDFGLSSRSLLRVAARGSNRRLEVGGTESRAETREAA